MKFADASDGLATKRLRSLKRPFAIKRAQALCGATFSLISGYQDGRRAPTRRSRAELATVRCGSPSTVTFDRSFALEVTLPNHNSSP